MTTDDPQPASEVPGTPREPAAHLPVMVDEVVEVFHPVPSGVLVDATVGAGGHATAVMEDRSDLSLLGVDRDSEAIERARAALGRFGDRVELVHDAFGHLAEVLSASGTTTVSGVLFDLGISSPQVDRAERGFSFRHDGPLDMRMDRRQELTAEDVVNGYAQDELAGVIARFGDERHARRIARAIVAARPIHSTGRLAEVVAGAVPAADRRRGHPARRTFQALRIEVNRELEQLPGALDDAIDVLVPEGRCAVLTYHSGEDRIVKDRLRDAVTGGCSCPPALPCGCGAVPRARWVFRGARRPSEEERHRNPRASSARLRAVERLGSTTGQVGPGKVVVG